MDNNFEQGSVEKNIDEFNSLYGNSYENNQPNYNQPNYNQPNYNQPNYNQAIPNNQYVTPTKVKPDKHSPETPEEHKKGNFFSGLSVACSVGSKLIAFVCAGISSIIGNGSTVNFADNPVAQGFGALLYGIIGLAEMAGFILMIYVRVKYPKNIFGKVLMWLYIIGFILYVIAAIVLIVTCISCANSCSGMG